MSFSRTFSFVRNTQMNATKNSAFLVALRARQRPVEGNKWPRSIGSSFDTGKDPWKWSVDYSGLVKLYPSQPPLFLLQPPGVFQCFRSQNARSFIHPCSHPQIASIFIPHTLPRTHERDARESKGWEDQKEKERERKRGWKQRSVQTAEHVNLSVSRVSLLHLINASVNRQTRCGEMALDGNSAGLESEGKRAWGTRGKVKGYRLQIKRRNKRLIMHPASSWCEEGTRRARKIQSGVDVVVLLHFVLLLSFLATLWKSNSRRNEGVKQGRTLPARFAWERHPNEKYKANYRSEMLLLRVANAKLAAVHRHKIIVDKIHGTKLKLIDNFAWDLWFGSNYVCKKYVRGTRREWNCFATVYVTILLQRTILREHRGTMVRRCFHATNFYFRACVFAYRRERRNEDSFVTFEDSACTQLD